MKLVKSIITVAILSFFGGFLFWWLTGAYDASVIFGFILFAVGNVGLFLDSGDLYANH